MSEKSVSQMSFEAAMAELEQVVSQLEGSEIALEDSIKLYDRGATLKKHCEIKLKEAEEKITQITLSPDGEPGGVKPFE